MGIRAADVASLISKGSLPFVANAGTTGHFYRLEDPSQPARDHASIATLANELGILSPADLERVYRNASAWSADFFTALASARGADKWRSEETFLYLLILVATRPDAITTDHLCRIGWAKDTAARTLDVARRFRARTR
jgi:hypothetical protein